MGWLRGIFPQVRNPAAKPQGTVGGGGGREWREEKDWKPGKERKKENGGKKERRDKRNEYLFPAILRILALKDTVKKRFKFIYKLSEVIPFF